LTNGKTLYTLQHPPGPAVLSFGQEQNNGMWACIKCCIYKGGITFESYNAVYVHVYMD